MINRFSVRGTLSAMLACALVTLPVTASASGGDEFSENVFTPEYHVPASELPGYARGDIGVVPASYWRVYHFLAYRALTGHSVSPEELKTLDIAGWQVGTSVSNAGALQAALDNWTKARKSVTGTRDVEVGTDTEIAEFDSILNCSTDAFERATKTLAQRLAQGGQQWAAVWLANQDAVFTNCSPQLTPEARKTPLPQRKMTMPAPLPPKAPEWLVKDHAYQSAAALFYAGRYDEARKRFRAIGKDSNSPWQSLGNYLAARCLLRKTALLPSDPGKAEARAAVAELWRQARKELLAASATYSPAKQLVSWVDFRLRPEERRVELSTPLATAKIDDETPQQLIDYLNLLDKMTPEQMMKAADPMTAWIGIMQGGAGGAYSDPDSSELKQRRSMALDLARTRWNAKHDTTWLLAVLTNAGPAGLRDDELKAAAAIKADAPAYVDAQYHLARHAIEGNKLRDADAIVSAMLKRPLPAYVRNRWLRMKMVTAQSAEEFFAAAPRVPAEREKGTPIPDEGKPVEKTALTFEEDLRTHLVRQFPLATLKRIKPLMPAERQKWLAELIWTRAVLLGDYTTADELVDDVAKGRDTTRDLYERYKKAAKPEEKHDAAYLILANTPELVPEIVGPAKQRSSSASEYWSCAYRPTPPDNVEFIAPAFLSSEERRQAEQEHAQLGKIPKRSTYLIPPVMAWVKAHRDDPDGPKALHFLVASTRNECSAGAEVPGDKRNYSREAFQVLHSQFPKSPWTAKTRYWY